MTPTRKKCLGRRRKAKNGKTTSIDILQIQKKNTEKQVQKLKKVGITTEVSFLQAHANNNILRVVTAAASVRARRGYHTAVVVNIAKRHAGLLRRQGAAVHGTPQRVRARGSDGRTLLLGLLLFGCFEPLRKRLEPSLVRFHRALLRVASRRVSY